MQRMIYRLIPILLFALALSTSCSIEKRIHTGGYYIQWHKRTPHATGHKEKKKPEPIAEADTTTVEQPEDTLAQLPPPLEVAHEPAAEPVIKDSVAEHPEKVEKRPKGDRKFEPVGVLAAKLLTLPILTGLLKDNAETHEQDYLLGIAFLFFLSICFFLGIVSMIYYLREPEIYRFNIWAILAIIVPLFLFILLLTDAADL